MESDIHQISGIVATLPNARQRALEPLLPLEQELAFHVLRFDSPRPGPALIVTAAVHGNETHGSFAIQRIVQQLINSELQLLCGRLSLVPVTNPKAWRLQQRQGDRNLNRRFRPPTQPIDYEDHVAYWLCPLLAEHDGLLDLHSFQSGDQAFALFGPENNQNELEAFAKAEQEEAIALRLGCDRFVYGWLDTYAKGMAKRASRLKAGLTPMDSVDIDPAYGVGTTEYMRSVGGWAITLECGQHDDPAGREVAYQAIINCLRCLGMLAGPMPEPSPKPEVMGLFDVFDRYDSNDTFARPWKSFDRVNQGEIIARRADGEIVRTAEDAYVIFPNPKAQAGQEWFYLARPGGRLGV
ncbi:MAG: succinylglutamate desuccinylase [Betaproteobacteria bacterium]|nr:succinylglutamate desuccinylase [Betaproteobacteria bacterium]